MALIDLTQSVSVVAQGDEGVAHAVAIDAHLRGGTTFAAGGGMDTLPHAHQAPAPMPRPSPEQAAFARADENCPFGPSFFVRQLNRLVRTHCPDPEEQLPVVHVYLADGQALDICHIIGVSPHWVVLAVRDEGTRRDGMAIELVPYPLIHRVSIRTRTSAGTPVGFVQAHVPALVGAESLLNAVFSATPPAP